MIGGYPTARQADEFDDLDGAAKAAVVLLAADKARSLELLKMLDPDEVRSISQGAERLGSINAALLTSVISNFEDTFHQGMKFLGTADEVRQLISEAVGEDTMAAAMAGAPQQIAQVDTWPLVREKPVEELRSYLVVQHPQVAAFILSKLDPEKSAEILQEVDADLCAELMTRMLSIIDPPGAVVRAIEEIVAKDLLNDQGGASGQLHADVASVLNRLDQARSATVIRRLQETRPSDAKTGERLQFRFDDRITLPQNTQVTAVEEVPVEQLVLALSGMTPEFQGTILSVLSARARRMAESELQNASGANPKTIVAARQFVVDTVLRLLAAGTIDVAEQ